MPYSDSDIELDFSEDWLDTIRTALVGLGYKAPNDPEKLQFAYTNLLKRLVPARPRKVHLAKGLLCPPALRAGLAEVTRKIEAGESVEQHLSTLLERRDYNDGMLNDWGLHHLHLGTRSQRRRHRRFTDRTGPILFVRFLRDRALFVGVFEHKATPAPFCDIRVLETFWANWPEEMARYELRGIAPSRSAGSGAHTDIDLERSRRGGIQGMVTIDGRVFGPMGGGISTAGSSIEVVTVMDRWRFIVADFETKVAESKAQIFETASAAGVELVRPVKMRMVIRSNGSAFVECGEGPFRFELGQFI
jgi:hypothetical protein